MAHIEYIGGEPVTLKEPFDLSFINQYGKIFKVITHGGWGSLCFGVEKGGKKYFIKFAGAPKESFALTKEEAADCLKYAEQVYKDLAHENVIKFVRGE